MKRVLFFQAEDGIRSLTVTGVQTCALPIWREPVEDQAHERFLGLMQERRPLLDLPQRRADGPAVERHGLARMGRQDDSLWGQCDQALQGRVERVSAALRLLCRRLEIRSTDRR